MKQDMIKAQKLLKDGKYDEAIKILATINHPIADKWRERAESLVQAQERQTKHKMQIQTSLVSCLYFSICGAILFFCIVIIPLVST